MNILFVVPYVPNLIRVRPYNFIRYLAKRGHHITLATLWTKAEELNDIARLQQEGCRVEAVQLPVWRSLANSLLALPTRLPLQAKYCWQPALAAKLDGLFAPGNGRFPFDAIHVEHLRGAPYGLYLKKLLAETNNVDQLPIIWDSVDCISLLFRQAARQSKNLKGRLMTQLDLKRTEQYETWLVSQFRTVLLTSPLDRQAFLDLLSPQAAAHFQSRLNVLPNGVDLEHFRPDPAISRDPATLVVSGKMSYHANISMVMALVQEVMPLVWAENPQVKLQIVGKDPARSILALAEHPQIEVTGTVPALPPYLQKATVAVAPVAYGVGIQNKVLEAMACATPVVASPQAVSALTAVNERDYLAGSEPAQLANLILRLLNDSTLAAQIGQNGYQFVSRQHNWTMIAAHLEAYYQRN